MNPASPACLALRAVLAGRAPARVALLVIGLDVGALALGAGRLPGWYALSMMGLAVIACVVAATVSLQAQTRRRELATLRTLGMSRTALVLMLELEALWISAAGTLLGLLGSSAVERIAAGWQGRSVDSSALMGAATGMPLLAGACGIAGVTLLAALGPALQAARQDLALALALLPAYQDR